MVPLGLYQREAFFLFPDTDNDNSLDLVNGLKNSLVLLSLGFQLGMVSDLQSKKIRVSALADPNNAQVGESWATTTNLKNGIALAEPGDEIWLSSGTYLPTSDTSSIDSRATFHLKGGITFLGGFSGTEDSKTERDPFLNRTILSGDLGNDDLYIASRGYRKTGFNATNVCTVVSAEETPVVVDGLTIKRGAPDFLTEAPGAGILCIGGKIQLRRCSFETNYS